MDAKSANRLVVLSLAGVDWPDLAERMRAGQLPALAQLAGRGLAMPLVTPPPLGEATASATIATGLLPEQHGVIADREGWAGGLRPASHASWQVPPIWHRLTSAGIATGGACWPASGPGSSWAGLHIDDRYAAMSGRDWNDWALPPDCAPPHAREALRELRLHLTEVETEALLPLVPNLAQLPDTHRGPLALLAGDMARAASEQAAATWLLAQQDWKALFVHHRWLGTVRARFDAPPPGYEMAVSGAWRFLDKLCAALVAAAGNATVLLVSPGWRQRPGVAMLAGPGIAPERQGAIAAPDVAPTILAHFGLRDTALPGRAFAFADAAMAPMPRDSWQMASVDEALLAEIVADGHAPPPGPPPAWRAETLGLLAEALVQRDPAGARDRAREALAHDPGSLPALRALGAAAIALEDADALEEIAVTLERLAPDLPWSSLARAAWHLLRGEPAAAVPLLQIAERAGDVETLLRTAAAWLLASRPTESRQLFERVLAMAPGLAAAELGAALAAAEQRDFAAAEAGLHRLLEREPGHAGAYRQLASVYTAQGRSIEAAQAEAAANRMRPLT